ncbi:MAG: alkaline phosphatase family protein [Thermodesulfobacteriota bacterium]
MPPRCCIVILLDGLGDRAYPELGGKTPLQAARTPFLDELAAEGCNGLFYPLRPGLQLPSENAHFAMFGYDQGEFPGRGYLEAAGANVDLQPADVALLAHFVAVERRGVTLHLIRHRPEATKDEELSLADCVSLYDDDDIVLRYHRTHGLDGVLVMRGAVSPFITDSDPLEIDNPLIEVASWRELAGDMMAEQSASVLNRYLLCCHRQLEAHPINLRRKGRGQLPINGIVTQRAGRWRQVPSFAERWGIKGLSIASGLVYWGLSSFLELDVLKVEDGADPGRDLAERLRLALRHSAEYQFIHVHTKTPDVAGHSKEPRNKVRVIESLDRGIGLVMDALRTENVVVVVTADHSTPSSGPLVHSGESVPFAAIGPGIRCDMVDRFDEVCCAAGGLGMLRGEDVMPLVLNWLDRSKLQGLMDSPDNQNYWPGRRKPLMME